MRRNRLLYVGWLKNLLRFQGARPDHVQVESSCCCFPRELRRRNTRYKNPQLVAQHCFAASFGRCLPFFTWRDQLDPQQKHLVRVEEMKRADWLIGSGTSKFVATKPKFVAQSRSALYFSQQLSSTRNKCFCCGSS